MSRVVLEWLEEARATAERGPLARVVIMRDGRSAERFFDVEDETDLGVLAEQIDASCQTGGFKRYRLRALDAQHRPIGSCVVGQKKRRLQRAAHPIERDTTLVVERSERVRKQGRPFDGILCAPEAEQHAP